MIYLAEIINVMYMVTQIEHTRYKDYQRNILLRLESVFVSDYDDCDVADRAEEQEFSRL